MADDPDIDEIDVVEALESHLNQTLTWTTKAAERAVASRAEFMATPVHDERRRGRMAVAHLDEFVLLTTAKQAGRIYKLLVRHGGISAEPFDAHQKVWKAAGLIRDIREHVEEYAAGGGRDRKKLVLEIRDGEVAMDIDANSNLVDGGDVRLGGRATVQEIIAALQALHAAFYDGKRLFTPLL